MTGILGAAGGFGGFLLPSALGAIKDCSGTFGLGFGPACPMPTPPSVLPRQPSGLT